MKTPEEETWDAILDAALPNAADMAAAEAELAELHGAPPLAPAVVQAVVQRTTAAVTARDGTHQAEAAIIPLHRSRRQFWLLAAVLFLSVGGLAWVVLEKAWPEEVLAPYTLDYAEAVRLATEPGRDEQTRLMAIGQIEEHCGGVAQALLHLETSANTDLANRAREIRNVLANVLNSEPQSQPGAVDPRFRDTIMLIVSDKASDEDRLNSLSTVQNQATSGLTALLLARTLFVGQAKDRHDILIQRLTREFSGSR